MRNADTAIHSGERQSKKGPGSDTTTAKAGTDCTVKCLTCASKATRFCWQCSHIYFYQTVVGVCDKCSVGDDNGIHVLFMKSLRNDP